MSPMAAAVSVTVLVVAAAWWVDEGRRFAAALRVRRRRPGLSRPSVIAPLVDPRGRVWHALRPRRPVRPLGSALPEWLEQAARSVRSGASLADGVVQGALAVQHSAPHPWLAEFVGLVDGGERVRVAVATLTHADHTDDARLAARALDLALDLGGAPAALLDRVAGTLRERAALRREAHALATQARASALVMALASPCFAALSVVLDPRVLTFALGSPVGVACVVVGLACEGVGAWWMVRLVRAAT